MGRRRFKNRKKNNAPKTTALAKTNRTHIDGSVISGAVTLTFLKRFGDYGLFRDAKGNKFNAHKTGVYGTLEWMHKGTNVAVKAAQATPVVNKRVIVQNVSEWNGEDDQSETDFDSLVMQNEKEPKHYVYGDDIDIVATNFESARMGLPIGTQYHWLTVREFPEVGDTVLTSINSGRSILGKVESINEESSMCSVGGVKVSAYDLSYKIVNPDFLKSFKFANA